MGKKVSQATRVELIGAVRDRYQAAARREKQQILDEFEAVTGYYRKHAIRLLSRKEGGSPRPRPARSRTYDEGVRQAVVVLWEASDRVCGKRLKSLIPTLVSALERHGHLQLDGLVRERVFGASAATLDRLLRPTRDGVRGRKRRARALPAVRRNVPVRTFADWGDPLPGFMEIDLVAHCGERVNGSFLHSLVLTDIASGWTECGPLLVREGRLVVESLARLRNLLPFPLRGIDSDNGTEFMNDPLLEYCQTQGIAFTRSRPYHKNDQAWVEQKNGSVVRRLVGYGRLEGLVAAEALSRLYESSRMFVNFFQPSFRLADKVRHGAKVTKKYHPPATPSARLLACPAVPDDIKDRLRKASDELDPLRLLDQVRATQHALARLAAGDVAGVSIPQSTDLDAFLRGLSTAWKDGEVRPTHRPDPKPARTWRTREDPFETTWPTIRGWLEAQPDRTAKELFQRLLLEQPGAFRSSQLRTLQRRVKAWRQEAARRLVFGETRPESLHAPQSAPAIQNGGASAGTVSSTGGRST